MWKITIDLYKDRYKEGVLRLWTYSTISGKYIERYRCPCLGRGTTYPDSPDSWKYINGNTPTGTWDATIDGIGDPEVYGPNPRIALTSISGNAYIAEHTYGRSGFMIHGGRADYEPPLYPTNGCIRVYDNDQAALVNIINADGESHGTVIISENLG
ncbi:hypothetical protein M2349_001930 [Caldanaerobacter subterraneus subsp. tengcongensis MB4]|uniref:L,D-TPase catalytic domain-containing protein n=2 Tax=Caldanaerobacter subterraneus TaxID=911092 RepID=Q8RCJ5_CALS4|nr:L,D-transpeptidase [Caldanaerobacter subterraneus]AAM23716.1 hypothetical protein TTE0432 [Caldanaerobacter subterraneus subsp. tengcongensis MB4]ERM93316.1 hypothetical protein O163_01415 [Caldanaerobacter subterraneus subsp. yonseiensis KB-1]MCS3916789.1 hypothetical protein [Caldanaerobacter subterraneus subsp. tengcongensis MB4]